MATQYAGGARRSVAPEYTPRAILGMSVAPQQQFTQQVLASLTTPAATLSQPFDSFWQGGGSTDSTAPASAGSLQGLNQAGAMAGVLGSLGALNQDPGLAGAGKALGQTVSGIGLAAQLSQAQSMEDAAKAFATNPAVMTALGLPSLGAGALAGSVKGGFEGAVTNIGKGVAYGAVPALGLVDATLSLFGVQTLADRLINAITGTGVAPTESGDINGGVDAGGVTVGGPMSTGDITGTPIGAPTGPEVSFSDISFGDFGMNDGGAGTDSDNGSDRGPGGSSGDTAASDAGADASGPGI